MVQRINGPRGRLLIHVTHTPSTRDEVRIHGLLDDLLETLHTQIGIFASLAVPPGCGRHLCISDQGPKLSFAVAATREELFGKL